MGYAPLTKGTKEGECLYITHGRNVIRDTIHTRFTQRSSSVLIVSHLRPEFRDRKQLFSRENGEMTRRESTYFTLGTDGS